ncbi:MAG TPA: 2Fe-2S iron-sulfur cluster-binding protein [Kofleriaceae bacterium]|nr:2Fe-2S iron-sulfur cluster-binding protein [Kofleriaceae bacterium]
MSTSDPVIDPRFAKRLVILNGVVPLALLAWDAWHHALGANEVNFAIHTTGLIGLIFLVLSLVVTPLRRLTGWAPLIAVRRNLGVLGFVYLALHFAIFYWFDREASLASTLHEIVSRVYLWFGTFALVALIPLAITSTDRMVSRLGARRWKRLHWLTYPIAIAGVIHYYLLVKSDIRQPLAFAIVTGALLVYRVAAHEVDLRRQLRTAHAKLAAARGAAPKKPAWWSGELVVARIFDETPDVKTFRLAPVGGGDLPFTHTAGQYLNLTLDIDGQTVRRSYTIASSPTHRDFCEISVKRAGDGHASHFLHDRLRAGDRLRVAAPAGRFIFAHDRAARCILIAGGVGITPMMATVRALTDRAWPGEIYLVFGVRREADIVFRDELAYLQARFANLHVCITLSNEPDPAWTGARGHITPALLRGFIPDLTHGPVLVCGPAAMMTALRRLLVDEIGLPDGDVLEEAFASPPSQASSAADAANAAADAASTAADEVIAASEAAPAVIEFQRTGTQVEAPAAQTVLEAAEDAGVAIPFECRSGICGQCKTRLVSGTVKMIAQDALTADDRARRVILACQAHAVGPIVVDA